MDALNQSRALPIALQMIDSTVIRAHHPAAGAKGGLRDRFRPFSGWLYDQRPIANAHGLPMRKEITPGQTSDHLGFDLVMADNLPHSGVLLADRDHDADSIRTIMERRNVLPVIPMRKSRKKRIGVDQSLYRLRNMVERCFNKLKNAGRIATRYARTAEILLGFMGITSIRLWARHLSTGPRLRTPLSDRSITRACYPLTDGTVHISRRIVQKIQRACCAGRQCFTLCRALKA